MTVPKYKPYLGGQGGVHIGLKPIEKKRWLERSKFFKGKKWRERCSSLQPRKNLCSAATEEEKKYQIEMLGELHKMHNTKKMMKNLQNAAVNNENIFDKLIELASLLIQEDLVLMIPKDDDLVLKSIPVCGINSSIEAFSRSLMKSSYPIVFELIN